MNGVPIGLMIEALVAVLLIATIGYCIVLNARLKRFRADEHALKATISELVTATEIAERAIHALKATVGDADKVIGQRLTDAEATAAELSRLIDSADRHKARTAAGEQHRPAVEPARASVARPANFAPRPAFATSRN
jgi:hypothetical protein